MCGKLVGHSLVSVVDATGDKRAIGVAFHKTDHHFLTHAGNPHGAPSLAAPGLGNPTPAGAVFILLALRVPIELDFDAAVFIDPDFFSGLTHHQCSLRTLNKRLRRDARGTKWNVGRNTRKVIRVASRAGIALRITAISRYMLNLGEHVA